MSNSAIEWTWQGLRVEAPLDHTDTTFSFWHVLISLHVYIYLHITYLFILYMPYIGRNYETPVWIMSLLQKVNRYVRVYRYKYIYIYTFMQYSPAPGASSFFPNVEIWLCKYVGHCSVVPQAKGSHSIATQNTVTGHLQFVFTTVRIQYSTGGCYFEPGIKVSTWSKKTDQYPKRALMELCLNSHSYCCVIGILWKHHMSMNNSDKMR